jgi:hypothetical protein
MLIFGNDVDAVEEDRFDRFLPRPEGERIVAQRPEVGIEDQGGATVRRY